MFGGAQTSAGHVGTAVATVVGGALGTLLIRNAVAVLAAVAAYGMVALVLYGAVPVRRWLRGLARGPEQAPRPPRRRRSWRVRGLAILLVAVLAACSLAVGYWGVGNGFAHSALWGWLGLAAVLAAVAVAIRWWRRSRPAWLGAVRFRAATAATACCAAAAGLSAGATLGSTNLVPPCPGPAELTVLTSQEGLAGVQAAIPGFERSEPARLGTTCFAVDVTAYAAPTDYDAWRGLESRWDTRALGTVGPRPDVWIPGSSAEVAPVRQGNGPRLTSLGSVASSPLVAAVPDGLVTGPLAKLPKLGSTWRAIYGTLRQAHAGLAVPDPAVSETARLGIAGLYPALTPDQQRGIESSGSFPADSTSLLCGAAQAAENAENAETAANAGTAGKAGTAGRPPADAYLVSETALFASDADQLTGGTCATLTERPAPLTAYYPDGAVALDFPFVTLNWGDGSETGGGGAAGRRALSGYETDFFRWLTGRAQPVLASLGLRPPGCGRFSLPPDGVAGAVPGCGPASLPTAAAVASAQASFEQAQAPARIVIGIDDSGPMEPYLPQITAAVDSELGSAATHLGAGDSFGIWKLPGDRKGQTEQQLVPFGPADVASGRVRAGVGVLTGHGHSADYTVLKRAGKRLYAQPVTDPEPGNSVILLTDGDGYPQGDPDGSSQLSVIGSFDRPPPGRSAIKLYIIAFGPEGCAESPPNTASQSLAAFADATGGTCLQANGSDPGRLLAQLLDQISTGR